ncbi:MAG: hypothetical protein ACKVVO_08150 [Opitutaceae bacterium]
MLAKNRLDVLVVSDARLGREGSRREEREQEPEQAAIPMPFVSAKEWGPWSETPEWRSGVYSITPIPLLSSEEFFHADPCPQ